MAVLSLLLGALLSPAAAQTALWVVDDDGGPGVDFAAIQLAIDAAATGDVVLVKPGAYAPFSIDGKGVAVVAESAQTVTVGGAAFVDAPAVIVRNTPAGAAVLLQRLTIRGNSPPPFAAAAPALSVSACAGPVALEELVVLPSPADAFGAGGSGGGVRVEASGHVRIARSTLAGGLPYALTLIETPSLAGLDASASDVALHGCALTGGAGSSLCGIFGTCGPSQPGGAGLRADSSVVYASGCAIAGGDGGVGEDCSPVGAGGEAPDGGDGVVLSGASALVLLDTTLAAGAAGTGCDGPASSGAALVQGAASVTTLAGSARGLSATTPATAGDVVAFHFSGEPFDLVLAGTAQSSEHVYLAPLSGLLLVGPVAFQVLVLGAADASGELSVPYASPPLPAGVGARIHLVQGAWLTTGGAALLGPAVSLVLHE